MKGWKRLLLALMLALSAAGAPQGVAEETPAPAQAHGEAAQGASGHEADKPPLLHWDLGSAFWSIVVFVILLAVLRAKAWNPILEGLHKREEFIRGSLADARREREEAQRLLADYTKKLEQARVEATNIVDEGRRDGEEVRKRIHAEAKAEADAMLARARKDIGIARDDAVKQLYDQAVLLAADVAGRLVRREMSAADHKRLVEESLAEMSRLRQ
jgi:F-type H+-transporting ATPase subunit b